MPETLPIRDAKDCDACFGMRAEVVCAAGQIGLKEIIGLDPDLQERSHQGEDNGGIIVDPFQQNSLAAQGIPPSARRASGPGCLKGDLVGVIEMGVDKERMEFFQDGNKPFCDAHGQGAWYPGADADDFYGRNSPQSAQEILQHLIVQQQRISAGYEDVLYFRCFF